MDAGLLSLMHSLFFVPFGSGQRKMIGSFSALIPDVGFLTTSLLTLSLTEEGKVFAFCFPSISQGQTANMNRQNDITADEAKIRSEADKAMQRTKLHPLLRLP